VVVGDVAGDKIAAVVQNGRPQGGMPPFPFSQQQILELAAFLHAQKAKADLNPGGRRGVEAADLQSGNVEAGKRYFNGTGTCSSCHSPAGDLAGIARRYSPLELEERMLYPGKSARTCTIPRKRHILACHDSYRHGRPGRDRDRRPLLSG